MGRVHAYARRCFVNAQRTNQSEKKNAEKDKECGLTKGMEKDMLMNVKMMQRERKEWMMGWFTTVKQKPFVPSDRKSTRLNSSHSGESRMPSSA